MPDPKPTPSGHGFITDPRTLGLLGGGLAILALAAYWLVL
jgi:hypothetical protein